MQDVIKPEERRKAEQLPLVFDHTPANGRDDLLVSARLAAAVSMVDSWPNWPSPVVVLTGPQGSGKSHLAEIWRKASGAETVSLAPGADAAAIAVNGPVLFEDADRRGFDETELFHLINSVRQHGTSLLITARTWPIAWNVSLPDLRSRLRAATLVEIGEPDEALLAQVIVKLFADRQLSVDERLVAYIVSRMERSFAAAQTIVEWLDRMALSRRVRISRALATEALDAIQRGDEASLR
ncbi:DnaA regulatory inactivator HdaA [Allorhizobium sp. BGMRC 0089]|uniref:DnaA regulatory inactivator HdaA n=1 Tax=Allorhizobium sonneratiae TaxID=2934936 RepID=UPI002034420C|nr:DnaA regulatory inactivator HdaA [Allorhizobium sonneratiae]MCM2292093.1 DnaA regulatory inactivator HdaA [Allorhizobium sonneratiae]